jgi:hypothetical protein
VLQVVPQAPQLVMLVFRLTCTGAAKKAASQPRRHKSKGCCSLL